MTPHRSAATGVWVTALLLGIEQVAAPLALAAESPGEAPQEQALQRPVPLLPQARPRAPTPHASAADTPNGTVQKESLQRPAPLPPEVRPKAPIAGPPQAVDPEVQAAHDLIPGLLEIGADLRPARVGVPDDGSNVLAAVNRLRQHDGVAPFERIGPDAKRYVADKVARFRAARARVIRMQYALSALGFDPGPIDGYFGPLTSHGVEMYQKAQGLSVTGRLNPQEINTLDELRVAKAVSAALTAPPPPGSVPEDTSPLTKPEIGKIRQQIEACWAPPKEARAAPELLVSLRVNFNKDGSVRSAEILNRNALRNALAQRVGDSALRAVFDPKCSPYKPPDKAYVVWKEVKLVLTPSLMD
ncbi:MAG TPA: peptidoglycan-binding protein [Alphaproteobacteria bacterium]|nr:peptidoglycan-binding protein [Alphaproteobacteria bacterium]